MYFIETVRFIAARIAKDEAGVTAVEYGLFAALIAAVIAGIIGTIGTDLNTVFGSVASSIVPSK